MKNTNRIVRFLATKFFLKGNWSINHISEFQIEAVVDDLTQMNDQIRSRFLVTPKFNSFSITIISLSSLSKKTPPSFLIQFPYSSTCELAPPLFGAHSDIGACGGDWFVLPLWFDKWECAEMKKCRCCCGQASAHGPNYWLWALNQNNLFPGFTLLWSLQGIKFQSTLLISTKVIHFSCLCEVEEF